jgi:phage shock protein PspC (stress-responsive transcriptional regulator)
MKKTININIAGVVFQIDDDAFEKLRSYLQEVNIRFRRIEGGSEALEDFEGRVAEIFQGRRGITGIVTMEDVNDMISVMGRPEDIDDGYEDDIRPDSETASSRRRLYRNPEERIIAGVAGGIGSYLNVDPVWIRLLFILFTVFYGFGFFVYIALWIALPLADSEERMKELCGLNWSKGHYRQRSGRAGAAAADRVGGAMNEIFRAFGNLILVAFRIFLIVIGALFILTGLSFLVMVTVGLFFNIGPWLPESVAMESFHFADLFPLMVNPALIPWIIVLSLVVITLPLFALIYWGIKMVVQFRAKDGLISIIALMIWVVSAASLTMLLFNEGISFAESGKSIERQELIMPGDSLRITVRQEASSINFDKEIKLPFDEGMTLYTTPSGKIYGNIQLNLYSTDEALPYLEVRKYVHGPSRRQAIEKAERLEYHYSTDGNRLNFDTFFALPDKSRWNGAMVGVSLYLPEGTSIFIDKRMEDMITDSFLTGRQNSGTLGAKWHTITRDSENMLRMK